MHVFTFFLKVGFHWISPKDCTWDFTMRDHLGNPGRVSGSGPVRVHDMKENKKENIVKGISMEDFSENCVWRLSNNSSRRGP